MNDKFILAQNLITTNKDILCEKVITSLSQEYPKARYDKKKCIRDMNFILDAVICDLIAMDSENCTSAGITYVHSYNGVTFLYQKVYTLFAIEELKKYTAELFVNDQWLQQAVESKFNTLIEIITNKTVKEVKWWDFAGRVAPFVALAAISLTHLINEETLFHISVVVTILLFFTTGVCWWWWSIYKIAATIIRIQQSQKKFQEISHEILSVKNDVKKLKSNDSNRKRGKSSSS